VTDKLACATCGTMILPVTFRLNAGLCAPCKNRTATAQASTVTDLDEKWDAYFQERKLRQAAEKIAKVLAARERIFASVVFSFGLIAGSISCLKLVCRVFSISDFGVFTPIAIMYDAVVSLIEPFIGSILSPFFARVPDTSAWYRDLLGLSTVCSMALSRSVMHVIRGAMWQSSNDTHLIKYMWLMSYTAAVALAVSLLGVLLLPIAFFSIFYKGPGSNDYDDAPFLRFLGFKVRSSYINVSLVSVGYVFLASLAFMSFTASVMLNIILGTR
jgi:hypothetical protein